MRTIALRAVALILFSPLPIGAQPNIPQDAPPPERPPLSISADTNAASAYFAYGSRRMDARPDSAYAGFYWASKLDPTSAEAYYARAIGLNIAWIHVVRDRVEVDPGYSTHPPDDIQARFDTLMDMAIIRDPFVDHRFDLLIYQRGTRVALSHVKDDYLHGFYSYAMHDFPEAAAAWARFLKSHPERLDVHVQRAQALYHANEFDSAHAEFAYVVSKREATPAKLNQNSLASLLYESKAMLLYSMGVIRSKQYDWKGAREDLGAALAEDLSLYAAHVRLARVDLALGDSAAAESELALAADVGKNDPITHYDFAMLLLAQRRWDDACAQFSAAIPLAPYFASPYGGLGRCEEGRGRPREAVAAYRAFITRAERSDTSLALAVAREKELSSALARAGTPP